MLRDAGSFKLANEHCLQKLAVTFAGLTLMGAIARVTLAWQVFADETPTDKG